MVVTWIMYEIRSRDVKSTRFCSVMVITLDSDSNNPGSIPGRTSLFFFFSPPPGIFYRVLI